MTRTHHPRPQLQLRLVAERDIVLGPGKIALLEAIEHHGSIAAACREMHLSYKKAWQLLETMGRHFDTPLVDTCSGGSQRGGATLTPLARELIVHYRALLQRLDAAPESEALRAMLRPLNTPTPPDR
ncbi:LysR family transcriptional regulator [Salinicola endophyticus]|uniref:LysR family transcriptional regulator n=1 Tax=Salinicola endophyticus TaxID=1949083 RepID=A0ABY8FJN1_9GAMM|nr:MULTISPECIES: LysR family transcriptional regulator [Salinicola]WFF43023.1 LysR family transcriptional regulator [Salinicola endophyticus]